MEVEIKAGAKFETVTPRELKDGLGSWWTAAEREKLRGVKPMSFRMVGIAGGTPFLIPGPFPGPREGYVWSLRSAVFTSSGQGIFGGGGDTNAQPNLCVGSDPNVVPPQQDVECIGSVAATQSILQLGKAFYPGSEARLIRHGSFIYGVIIGATTSNTYMLRGQAWEVPAEMVGKLW